MFRDKLFNKCFVKCRLVPGGEIISPILKSLLTKCWHNSLLSPSEVQADLHKSDISSQILNKKSTPATSILLKATPRSCAVILKKKKKKKALPHYWGYQSSTKTEAVKGSDLGHHWISNIQNPCLTNIQFTLK